MKTISIAITYYNGFKYLPNIENLFSCWSTLPKKYKSCLSIIIIDDGSKCSFSREGLCDAVVKFEGILNIQIIYKNNGGLSSARNEAIKRCGTEYIRFLDCDDFISNESLMNIMGLISSNNFSGKLILSDFMVRKEIGWDFRSASMNRYLIFLRNNQCYSITCSLESIKGLRYDESMTSGLEDWEFLLRAIVSGVEVEHTNAYLIYRESASGMLHSHTYKNFSEICAFIARKNLLQISKAINLTNNRLSVIFGVLTAFVVFCSPIGRLFLWARGIR